MSRFTGFLIIFLLGFYYAACGLPIGTIGGSGVNEFDGLLVVPHRVYYNIGQNFNRNADLSVYTVSRGVLLSISTGIVEIGFIADPLVPEDKVIIPLDDPFPLDTTGRKLITVTYENLEEQHYSIEVRDPLGIGNGNGSNGGGQGIDIVWAPYIVIGKQPVWQTNVTQNAITGNLSVEAHVTDGSTILEDLTEELSFQWYLITYSYSLISISTEIPGATSSTFTIPTNLEPGTHYYLAEVRLEDSDTTNPVRSLISRVIVSAP
ncbi:MAG: hypothetical protein FWG77_08355 [Treponema sp.]|nr:hypothetical protein [Treponema sp.]